MPNHDLTLDTVLGPQGGSHVVRAPGPASIGRGAGCEVCLMHEGVSRRHAGLLFRAGGWVVTDTQSTHGTFVNGVRLAPGVPTPITSGDLVRVGPWTFRAVVGRHGERTSSTFDDTSFVTSRIELATERGSSASGRRLKLLTECIAGFGSARDEETMARAALNSALRGSGYSRGAVLRVGADGMNVSVLVSSSAGPAPNPAPSPAPSPAPNAEPGMELSVAPRPSEAKEFVFSRRLIQAASAGKPVVLAASASLPSVSLMEMQIQAALCVPIMLGETPAAYLYLDTRETGSGGQDDSASYCEAVATALGLALANLKRAELDRRQRELTAELSAAHDAQRLILPSPAARVGLLRYAMHMRPGVFVAGDLFDVVPISPTRVAFCVGDVSGHGAGSAMVMATAQSFLHACLRAGADASSAVRSLNEHLAMRVTDGRFVSLWLGVLEESGEMEFVDAGHGYCLRRTARGATSRLVSLGGIPLGIDPGHHYRADRVRLDAHDRILLFSDGLVEQRNAGGKAFGIDRVGRATERSASPQEDVDAIMGALDAFTGGGGLEDDATVASLDFGEGPGGKS